uniref:Copper type II ascorbate-dependent monooxygenase C-terminal domain-containing protein n=1 Tax=Skeletonema marinoi TaxID=267567 RepID=A0A7S2PET8_9STRA|mmetsp:Transcript_19996/g.33853  ORF Transcript_19996/g.33853 Transcript_19996/m.33853 type:complete len:390 (+) Transcript_19996:1316-2485(+)
MEAGIPMGYGNENVDSSSSSNDGGGYKAFRLEVHYHNPHRRDGMLDQSGVRIYYSIKKREHVAGLMLLGDYMLKLRGSYTVGAATNDKDANSTTAIVASSSKEFGYGMKHSFYCPSSCFSKERLGRNSVVTVFREVLHMHKSGERMTNIHMDSNGTILRASEANYFDFSRGAGYGSRVNLPYQINEGDSFVTSCYFAKRGTTWGSSSGDEMCQTFMWYYPQEEDFSLSCGYADALTRKANDTLDPLGCEVSYDRKQVPFDMERVKLNELCQATEASKRPISIFDSTVDTRQEWPSLAQLVNRWKQSRMPVEPSTNLTTPSSITKAKSTQATLQEDCRLCPNGQRPTHPDTVIEGFSWTCDELDAAIPVLYTEPELLFFSIFDVPKCEDY